MVYKKSLPSGAIKNGSKKSNIKGVLLFLINLSEHKAQVKLLTVWRWFERINMDDIGHKSGNLIESSLTWRSKKCVGPSKIADSLSSIPTITPPHRGKSMPDAVMVIYLPSKPVKCTNQCLCYICMIRIRNCVLRTPTNIQFSPVQVGFHLT